MINFLDLENKIKKNEISNFYIFCGFNESLIKSSVNKISSRILNKDFIDLNYFEYDGNTVQYDEILNACETLPFMSEKKVVVVYRSDFLTDRTKNVNKNGY